MTTKVVTDDQLGQYSRRERELVERMRKGVVPFNVVMHGMQSLMEWKPPVGAVSIGYTVSIDRSLPLLHMLREGKYDNHGSAIAHLTEERYPVNRSGELEYDKELFLVAPSCEGLTTKQWMEELETNGWRLEAAPELLALGAKYPDLQREQSIVSFDFASEGYTDRGDAILLGSTSISIRSKRERWIEKTWYSAGYLWPLHSRALVSREQETITVPNLYASELIALAERSFQEAGIPLTYLNSVYSSWDFLLNERGKTFKVFTHNFGRKWESEEPRIWQKSVGADGNIAAFIAWVIEKKPMGRFAAFPNDDKCLFRSSDDDLFVPFFDRDSGDRRLDLLNVRRRWDAGDSVVAFSAI